MPKRRIGVRLDQEVIDKLSEKGQPSTVIRDLIMDSFKPKPPPKTIVKEVIREVIKKSPREALTIIDLGSDDWTTLNKRLSKMLIIEDIIKLMPQWYIKHIIKRHEIIYESIDEEILESYKKRFLEDY